MNLTLANIAAEKLGESILNILSDYNPHIARDIAKELNVNRQSVNSFLYNSFKSGKVPNLRKNDSDAPPTWWLEVEESKKENKTQLTKETNMTQTIIMIDGGNIHDVLQHVEKYADNMSTFVYFFADMQTACYGTKTRPPTSKNVLVRQSKSPFKNAADVDLIWTTCDICAQVKRTSIRCVFYVVTKDNQFQSLKDNVQEAGHELVFCNSWEQLREYIE